MTVWSRTRAGLEDRQLAGPPLLLSAVVQPQHRLVHHPGEQEHLLDLLRRRHPPELIPQRHGDLRLEQPLLLFITCHACVIISKDVEEVKKRNVDLEMGY